MTDTNIKIHMIISTLLSNISLDGRTSKSNKVKKNYRVWNVALAKNQQEKYLSLAKEADDAWNRMNERLSADGQLEQISLPTTLVSLCDMVQGGKSEHVVNPDFFVSMIDGQTDDDEKIQGTEAMAILVADTLREELGVKPRAFAGKMKLAMKIKQQNDILSEGK